MQGCVIICGLKLKRAMKNAIHSKPPPSTLLWSLKPGNYNPINTNFHQKMTFVETLVKYGKVMQNLPKIRSYTRSKDRPFCFTLPPPLF